MYMRPNVRSKVLKFHVGIPDIMAKPYLFRFLPLWDNAPLKNRILSATSKGVS